MSYFNQLYALVQEVEANTARVADAHAEAGRRQIRRSIPGGLGSVTVSGASGLEAVDLDRRMLRYTNAKALGVAVRQAIEEAEAEYRASYLRSMAEASSRITV